MRLSLDTGSICGLLLSAAEKLKIILLPPFCRLSVAERCQASLVCSDFRYHFNKNYLFNGFCAVISFMKSCRSTLTNS